MTGVALYVIIFVAHGRRLADALLIIPPTLSTFILFKFLNADNVIVVAAGWKSALSFSFASLGLLRSYFSTDGVLTLWGCYF